MGKSFSLGDVHIGTDAAPAGSEVPEKPALKIVVLGDFSGRGSKGSPRSSPSVRTRWVDRDNYEELLKQLNPHVHDVPVTPSGATGSVGFESLDDFHPDALLRRVAALQDLRALRRRLADRSTFAAAMEEARNVLQPPRSKSPESAPSSPPPPPPAAKSEPIPDSGSLLDQVLAATESQAPLPTRPKNQVELFAQEVMASYTIPADDPRQEPWLEAADQAAAFAVKRLIQQRHFRELEARWRGLDWLTRRIESDTAVKIAIVDLSFQELRADLAHEDLNDSAVYELLALRPKKQPGDTGWQVIVLDERLAGTVEDIELIGRLSQLATDARATLLIGLTDEAVSCTVQGRSFVPSDLKAASSAWNLLQQLPDAAHAVALWPGYLVRQPYGKATSEVETLACEELEGLDAPAALLWGNSAYLAAAQLMRAGEEDLEALDINGLPCLVLPDEDGEKRLVPAAAWWLRDNSFDQLNDLGVTPVCALTQAGTVRVFALRNLHGESL